MTKVDFPWRKLWICWAICKRSKLESSKFPWSYIMICSSIQIWFAKDDHTYISVQINFSRFRAGKPMIEIHYRYYYSDFGENITAASNWSLSLILIITLSEWDIVTILERHQQDIHHHDCCLLFQFDFLEYCLSLACKMFVGE